MLLNPLWNESCGDLPLEPWQADSAEGLVSRLWAQTAREANLRRADEIYRAVLERAGNTERESRGFAADESRQARLGVFLSTDVSLCTIAVQPFLPQGLLIEPRELQNQLAKVRVLRPQNLPSLYEETIPGGLLFASSRSGLYYECEQIYVNGLIHAVHECAYNRENHKILYLGGVAERLVLVLQAARNLFRLVDFQGEFTVTVKFDGVGGCFILPLLSHDISYGLRDPLRALLASFRWDKTFFLNNAQAEEAQLGMQDNGELQEFGISLIQDICWGLGHGRTERAHVQACLKQFGLGSS